MIISVNMILRNGDKHLTEHQTVTTLSIAQQLLSKLDKSYNTDIIKFRQFACFFLLKP